ncbi:hypothetical protein [Bifidobacterium saguinibicoloris]|uniref:hypothetical protein n=1 Tax=Bifidobacterium saguinibicoloris TaxID=2834433 RepID=UPI001C57FF66|nr:hypothetical protein [Bifidobacterium saguinibicoloris]MBW3080884.1 hypothetical protein [Bifidobacterium saguinibicoloris]
MPTLKANPGEREIMAADAFIDGKSAQVLLTDRNLTCGILSFFETNFKEIRTYPVNRIAVVDDNAQVRINADGAVEVTTDQGRVVIGLKSRRDAKRLSEYLRSLATGKDVDTSTDDGGLLAGMAEALGGTLKDTVGSFTKELGLERRQRTTAQCDGCGATLTGAAGDTVQCPYCDTPRQL